MWMCQCEIAMRTLRKRTWAINNNLSTIKSVRIKKKLKVNNILFMTKLLNCFMSMCLLNAALDWAIIWACLQQKPTNHLTKRIVTFKNCNRLVHAGTLKTSEARDTLQNENIARVWWNVMDVRTVSSWDVAWCKGIETEAYLHFIETGNWVVWQRVLACKVCCEGRVPHTDKIVHRQIRVRHKKCNARFKQYNVDGKTFVTACTVALHSRAFHTVARLITLSLWHEQRFLVMTMCVIYRKMLL